MKYLIFIYSVFRKKQSREILSTKNGRIAKGKFAISMINRILWDKQIFSSTKIESHKPLVKNVLTYCT